MADLPKLKDRYELREILGKGGMGVVYRAYDGVLKCDVAVKTLRQAPDPAELQLFYRECEVLVGLNHPNIVQILDIGKFEEEGQSKPYFVMPLLPGMTLDKLIRSSGTQLTIQRCVEILSQVCRGLHAAHERGLIHRDIKPGNVFVMPDYSAEIIDFGIAHMLSSGITGQKGTLLYMAPELIEGKPPSQLSDVFALGVMAYELFTRRRPFERPTEREIVEAILHESPPPASDLDASINQGLSRVLHKSLAKQPWHRFSTAREFAECLEKAYRGDAIEYFDTSRILPRIQRARSAFEQGDHQFAIEIVAELEAEGHLDPDLALLRRQLDIAVRQKRIRQLVESARSRMEGEEYPLALQKVQEILSLEPGNAEGLSLKAKIESARSEGQIEGWFRLARQHIDNNAFAHASEALRNVLEMRPQDTRAANLLAEVRRKEQEYLRLRQEKDQLYQLAVESHQKGDVSQALSKLERVLEIERRAPDSTSQDRGNIYQNLYNQVRSEHDAIQNAFAEARKHLTSQEFAATLAICDEYLQKYPGHALFQSLKFDAEEQQRLQLSAFIAEIDRRVEAESDLERRINIITEALDRFPGEPHFERLLRITRERLDLVSGIIAKARYHEERGQFTEALGQWEILRTIHTKYPGLLFEIERVTKRRTQQSRTEAKTRWVQQIDAFLEAGEYERGLETVRTALEEFPGDGELASLEQLVVQGKERCAEANRLHAEGERLFDGGAFEEGLETLQRAYEMDKRSDAIRDSLTNRLLALAQRLVETDWRAAELLVQRGLALEPSHAGGQAVSLLLQDLRREDFLNQAVARIRKHQARGDAKNAMAELEQALSFYPDEPRLVQLRPVIEAKVKELDRSRDLEQIRGLAAGVNFVSEPADIQSVLELMRTIAGHYPGDLEFQWVTEEVEEKVRAAAPQGLPAAEALAAATPVAQATTQQKAAAAIPAGVPPSHAATPVQTPAPAAGILPVAPPAHPDAGAASESTPAGSAEAAQSLPASAAAPLSPKARSKAAPRRAARSRMIAIAAGLVLLLAGAGVVLALYLRGGLGKKVAQNVAFEIRSTPPGARLELDGKPVGAAGATVQLAPGDYRLHVVLDGYRTEVVPVILKAGQVTPALTVALQPLPQQLRIASVLSGAKYSLDGAEPIDFPPAGQVTVDLTPGRHALSLQVGAARATFAFEGQPGALPNIDRPAASKGLDAVITSVWKDRALVQSSIEKAPVTIGGREAGQLDTKALELANLVSGPQELAVGAGDRSWYGSLESTPIPTISAFVISTDTAGRILVEVAGTDGARVLLDGAEKGLTSGGRLRFSAERGAHEIRVEKDGFLEAPRQRVAVETGKQTRAAFVLVARPAPVAAAPPRKLPAKVRIEVSPPSAQVTYSRNGDNSTHEVSPGVVELEEGNYFFTARAPGHVDKSIAVAVEAGGALTINLNLAQAVVQRKAPPRPVVHAMDVSDWEKPWRQDGEWFTQRGGNAMLYKITPSAGTYQFTLRARGSVFSGPKVRWLANYVNEGNYILFEMERQAYSVTEYRDGKKITHVDKKRLASRTDAPTIRMTVAPDRLIVALLADGSVTEIDNWTRPSPPFSDGRFGFYVPGDAEMWLSNFTFTELRPR